MAKGEAQIKTDAFNQGWSVVKRRGIGLREGRKPCEGVMCMAQVPLGQQFCERCQTNKMDKGQFRGYSKNNISDRATKQGKRRAWGQSRKNQSKRTANRYKRAKIRGSGSGARPKMRRQLGAGGKRPMRNR